MRNVIATLIAVPLCLAPAAPQNPVGRAVSPDTETILQIRIAEEVLRAWLEQDPLPDTDGRLVAAIDLLPRATSHARNLPRRDGWGHPLSYWTDGHRFVVVSTGADGLVDRAYDPSAAAVTADPRSDDYVLWGAHWLAGRFLQRPMTAPERLADHSVQQVRSLSWAVGAYAIDNNRYPILDASNLAPAGELEAYLVPNYASEWPLLDGWGHELLYWSDGLRVLVVSLGSDGELDFDLNDSHPPFPQCGGAFDDTSQDTVMIDQRLCQWPRLLVPHPQPYPY
jgi:hypothetical protein